MTDIETSMPELNDDQEQWLADAAELLAHLRRHPELINLYLGIEYNKFEWPDVDGDDGLRARLRRLVRALVDGARVGTVTKRDPASGYVGAIRDFGVHQLRVTACNEATCEMVDTGEVETVEVVEVPDEVAAAYTRTETKPVLKRVCRPLLGEGEQL
jgi:hypothetical protein